MSKKFLTMADKVKRDIDKVKEILAIYNERDIKEVKDKKEFMEEHLKELEESYIKYQINNELYYEPGTYEYFKDKFSNLELDRLNYRFVAEVTSFAYDDVTPQQKVKILKAIVKAYTEKEQELLDNSMKL